MDMTIIEQAKGLADKVLAQHATEHDIAVVERVRAPTPSVIWPCPPSNMSSIRPYAVAQWKTKSRRWE